jgi:hypothetical protein
MLHHNYTIKVILSLIVRDHMKWSRDGSIVYKFCSCFFFCGNLGIVLGILAPKFNQGILESTVYHTPIVLFTIDQSSVMCLHNDPQLFKNCFEKNSENVIFPQNWLNRKNNGQPTVPSESAPQELSNEWSCQ